MKPQHGETRHSIMFSHKESDRREEQQERGERVAAGAAPPMSLRALHASDIDTVMEIERRCFTSHWSREAL